MTATTSRRAVAAAKLKIVPPAGDRQRAFWDLECQIGDLERAAHIAFHMAMHDLENPEDEPLGLFAIEQVERLASELRASFKAARESVQS